MMVLCFLMSIPLKMMAETVTVHFIDENKWTVYDAYVFDASTSKPISTDHAWPGKRTNYTTETINGYKVVTWTIDLESCSLGNARIIFNNRNSGDGNQFPPHGAGFFVHDDHVYNSTKDLGTLSDFKKTDVTKEIKLLNGTSELTGSNGKYTLDLSGETSDAKITLTIDGAKYGLATAQTISAAGTTNVDFVANATAALTLKAGLIYFGNRGWKDDCCCRGEG